YGDSFAEGFLLKKSFALYLEDFGYKIHNYGKNGFTSKDVLNIKKDIPKEDILIVFIGTNDFLNGYSVDRVISNIKKIVSNHKKTIIVTPPFVEEEFSYPVYESTNRKIKEYKNKIKKEYLIIDSSLIQKPEYFIDGIHLREKFHEKLSVEIDKLVKKAF